MSFPSCIYQTVTFFRYLIGLWPTVQPLNFAAERYERPSRGPVYNCRVDHHSIGNTLDDSCEFLYYIFLVSIVSRDFASLSPPLPS